METTLRNEIKMVLDSYIRDPADSPYQRGYLSAYLDLNNNLRVINLNTEEEDLLRAQCKEPSQ
jgi:hypothetical protein